MKQNVYTIQVRTGSDSLAGTDSNVYIRLMGTEGQTEEIHLPARDIFAFEAGSVDTFVLEVPDIGELQRCCIGHDNSDHGFGWHLLDVRVEDDETDRTWVFTFDRWLGADDAGELYACCDI